MLSVGEAILSPKERATSMLLFEFPVVWQAGFAGANLSSESSESRVREGVFKLIVVMSLLSLSKLCLF